MFVRVWRKRNSCTVVVGTHIGAATVASRVVAFGFRRHGAGWKMG